MLNNYINHVIFVLDMSGSMINVRESVIKAVDDQVAYLAQRSRELDQETRVSVFVFNTDFACLVYDKDVLRLPSLRETYRPAGQTALIDAVMLALADMSVTPIKYGQHAFLVYVLTDGQENASRTYTARNLGEALAHLYENWTLACLVPDQTGVFEAKKFGFPADNIAVWDATSRLGVERASTMIRDATETYLTGRASGVVGTRNLFKLKSTNLNEQVVAANLTRLPPSSYRIFAVPRDATISDFVEAALGTYVRGHAYYQITKPETVQVYKQVCVQNRSSGAVYGGAEARHLLGLPDFEVKVTPGDWSQYDIFVQSTSMNRKLIAGTSLLVLL